MNILNVYSDLLSMYIDQEMIESWKGLKSICLAVKTMENKKGEKVIEKRYKSKCARRVRKDIQINGENARKNNKK